MRWTREREALYDADELARARKKRGLPDYAKVRAPRAPAPTITCRFEGCDAPVHYYGAGCIPCRLAEAVREEAEKAAALAKKRAARKAAPKRERAPRPVAKKVRCTVCGGPMRSAQVKGKYPCHMACRPYLLDMVDEREAA